MNYRRPPRPDGRKMTILDPKTLDDLPPEEGREDEDEDGPEHTEEQAAGIVSAERFRADLERGAREARAALRKR